MLTKKDTPELFWSLHDHACNATYCEYKVSTVLVLVANFVMVIYAGIVTKTATNKDLNDIVQFVSNVKSVAGAVTCNLLGHNEQKQNLSFIQVQVSFSILLYSVSQYLK